MAKALLTTDMLSWISVADHIPWGQSRGRVLQPLWDYLLQNHHDLLRSPLFPVFLSISIYFLLIFSFTVLDLLAPTWPRINRYRIHPDKPVTWAIVWTTLGVTVTNHVLYIFPATVAQWLWRSPIPLPPEAPTLWSFFLGIFGCMVVFDFQYFLWHLIHHRVSWLYRTVHAVHHQYSQLFSLITQHMSGWELFNVGFLTTVDPILFHCHCLTMWGFMVFNIYVSTEDHCGYDFPWALHNLVPLGLWGGAPKHDAHHQRPSTNFAPFFSHWDLLLGTHDVPGHRRDPEAEDKKGEKG